MEHPFSKPRGGTIETVNGVVDEAQLHRLLTTVEDDNEIAWAVEYRAAKGDPVLLHRSVHVHLKQAGVTGALLAGNVGS